MRELSEGISVADKAPETVELANEMRQRSRSVCGGNPQTKDNKKPGITGFKYFKSQKRKLENFDAEGLNPSAFSMISE